MVLVATSGRSISIALRGRPYGKSSIDNDSWETPLNKKPVENGILTDVQSLDAQRVEPAILYPETTFSESMEATMLPRFIELREVQSNLLVALISLSILMYGFSSGFTDLGIGASGLFVTSILALLSMRSEYET